MHRTQQVPLKFGVNLPRRCVYCGGKATTRDHVLPRCLLEKPFPQNLLTVPSCRECNESYSCDEEYLNVVISNIGHAPQLVAKVERGGAVDRALERAPALDQRIVDSLEVGPDGQVCLKPERERILKVMRKIAYGLFIFRYRKPVTIGQFSALAMYGPGEDVPLPVVNAYHYQPGTRRKPWTTVQKGVFSYLFAKSWLKDDPHLYCLVNLHSTLLGVVACPDPRSGGWVSADVEGC